MSLKLRGDWVASPGNLCGEKDEVPTAICRSDGTVPKGRREPRLLDVMYEELAKCGQGDVSDDG